MILDGNYLGSITYNMIIFYLFVFYYNIYIFNINIYFYNFEKKISFHTNTSILLNLQFVLKF